MTAFLGGAVHGTTAEGIYGPVVHMVTTWESTEGDTADENIQQVYRTAMPPNVASIKSFTGTPWNTTPSGHDTRDLQATKTSYAYCTK